MMLCVDSLIISLQCFSPLVTPTVCGNYVVDLTVGVRFELPYCPLIIFHAYTLL